MEKLLELENDGLNTSEDGGFLFMRCKRDMIKYSLTENRLTARRTVFSKDGKARDFTVCGDYIFLYDFRDLYILKKTDLSVIKTLRVGSDLSSDLGYIVYGGEKVYVAVRNGRLAVFDINAFEYEIKTICDSSFWSFCLYNGRLYFGTVKGELIEADAESLSVLRKINLCKKNIYSVVRDKGIIYTVSQDMTVKAVNISSFEVISEAKKAVKGMVRILGLSNDRLVIADRRISLFDKDTLEPGEKYDFPAGWNSGALLVGNSVYGGDPTGIYKMSL